MQSDEVLRKSLVSNPNSQLFKFTITDFEFGTEKFEELINGKSLFLEKFIVLCDGLMDSAEVSAFILKRIDEISESKNLFIFREGKLDKKKIETFKKAKAKIEEFSVVEVKKGYVGAREVKLRAGYEDFNIFSFTDALGSRDRKLAWVQYQKALRAGFPADEMFWKAVWLFRIVILVSPINKNQKDIEVKLKISPFALKNSRRFLNNYPEDVLIKNYRKLVDICHQSRRGVEMDTAMEQFILNL